MSDRGLFDVTEEEIARAKEKYWHCLTTELVTEYEKFDDFNKEFLWRHIALHAQEAIDEEFIRRLKLVHPPDDVPEEEMSLTPFQDAERSLSTGRWFSGGIVRRML